jgi:plastocyanin
LETTPNREPTAIADSATGRRSRWLPLPPVLLAVPVIVGGLLLPATGASLRTPAADVVGMRHEHFDRSEVTIRRGQVLRLQNNSRFIHIIGAGRGGHLQAPGHEPVQDLRLMEQNDRYVTGRWTQPGTYYLTCSVHPEMTVKVVVTP